MQTNPVKNGVAKNEGVRSEDCSGSEGRRHFRFLNSPARGFLVEWYSIIIEKNAAMIDK